MQQSATVRSSRALAADFGPVTALVADPRVTDVFVNGAGPVWVDRGSGAVGTAVRVTEAQARELAVRLIAAGQRHLDEAEPCADARLADGIRVHAVLPPVARGGTALSIRLPAPRPPALADLADGGFLAVVPADLVAELVRRRVNLLVTGASGSGNTTWNV